MDRDGNAHKSDFEKIAQPQDLSCDQKGLGGCALNKLKRTGPRGAVLSVEGKMIAFYPACYNYLDLITSPLAFKLFKCISLFPVL